MKILNFEKERNILKRMREISPCDWSDGCTVTYMCTKTSHRVNIKTHTEKIIIRHFLF